MTLNNQESWQKAGITNDFIFGNVMQMGNNCRDLLRAILPDLNIQQTHFINTQKDIRDKYNQKGIRMDVFAEDEQGRVFDAEMQVTDEHNLGKRIRYYQSKIDMDSLKSGDPYTKIKPSYVIFLCSFDPMKKDLCRYDLQWRCDEDPRIVLDTGTHVILLNSTGSLGYVTEEMKSFFALMNGMKTDNDFGRQLIADIQKVKNDPDKERDYMDMAMKIYDARMDVVETLARNLKNKGYDDEKIRQNLHDLLGNKLSDTEINQVVKSLK